MGAKIEEGQLFVERGSSEPPTGREEHIEMAETVPTVGRSRLVSSRSERCSSAGPAGGEVPGARVVVIYKLFEPKVSGTATGREVLCLGRFLFQLFPENLSCRFRNFSKLVS